MRGPAQNFGPIGLTFLKLIGHTNKPTKKTETDKQSIHIDNVDEIKKFQSFTLLLLTETKLVFQIGLRFEEDDLIREGKRD